MDENSSHKKKEDGDYPFPDEGEAASTPSPTARLSPTDRLIVSRLNPKDDHDIGPVEEIPLDGPIGTTDQDEPATTSRHVNSKRIRKLRHESSWFQSPKELFSSVVDEDDDAEATPAAHVAHVKTSSQRPHSDIHYGLEEQARHRTTDIMPAIEDEPSRSASTDFSLPPIQDKPAGPPRQRKPPQSSNRSSASLPVSSFDSGTPVDLSQPRTATWIWLALGLAAGLGGQLAAWWFFHASDTLGGAMMFSIAMLAGSIFPLFQRNSKEIWTRSLSPNKANAYLTRDILAVYLGLLAGYAALPLIIGTDRYAEIFSAISGFVDTQRMNLMGFDHGQFFDILLHNCRVFFVFFLIGMLFRYVGTLIVIVYNAATWGVVLAAAASGAMVQGLAWYELGIATLAIAPHIVLETVAYVLGSMAGIFLSRGGTRYAWLSLRFKNVGKAVMSLVLAGLAFVVLSALFESWWAHSLIQFLFKDAQATGQLN